MCDMHVDLIQRTDCLAIASHALALPKRTGGDVQLQCRAQALYTRQL